jgi:hypothetical protein
VFSDNASLLNPTYTGTLTGSTGILNIGSGQVYKDASGNVGIGTSSPSSYGKLAVLSGDNTEATVVQSLVSNNTTAQLRLGFNRIVGYNTVAGNSSLDLGVTSSPQAMHIDSSGNVGIGTSSPPAKFTVAGDSFVSYTGSAGLLLRNISSENHIDSYNYPITANYPLAILGSLIRFSTQDTERIRIDSAGNVGIGNSSPTTKLDVTGTVTATTFSGAGTSLTGTANSLNAGLGVNQTWQAPSRAIGTTYTNSTGKPITVAISYTNSTANTVQGLVIAGTTVYASGCPVLGFGSGFSLVVPNGATYVTTTNGGTMTLVTWAELR